MSTTVLMLSPLGGFDLRTWCAKYATRNGRVAVKVPTTDNPKDKADPSTVKADGRTLHAMIKQYLAADPGGDIILLAHSRGCQVVGEWLAVWSHELSDADAARVRAVLTGNLERERFGFRAKRPRWYPQGNGVRCTPENTRFKVLDIGRRGDMWANYPGGIWPIPFLVLCLPHLDYFRVDPDNLKPISGGDVTVGNTRYVNVA